MIRIVAILGLLIFAADTRSDPATLPLLGDSNIHLSAQEAYEGFPDDVLQAVAAKHAELVDAGMDTARHLFDWGTLEPSPGVYDLDSLLKPLDQRLATGINRQFCNITVIDSGGPEALPPYINDLLDAGVAWDDPQIVGPFLNLLDAVVPLMLDRGTYMLGVANEPGGYFEDQPADAASFAGFVSSAIERIHTIEPNLAATVVFAGTTDPAIQDLMPLVDIAVFNAYAYSPITVPDCQVEGFPVEVFHSSLPDTIGSLLDDLIATADGKLICIQEFGQSTGWNDTPVTLGPNAGLTNQAAIIDALADALDARRQHFRTVSIWTLNDHTVPGMQYLADPLLAAGLPPCYVDNIVEIFGPTGLVRSDSTATPKPAFDAFKSAVTRFTPTPVPACSPATLGIMTLAMSLVAMRLLTPRD